MASTGTANRNSWLTATPPSTSDDPRWPAGGETVRYLRRPFEGRSEDFVFEVTSVNFTWSALWARAREPS